MVKIVPILFVALGVYALIVLVHVLPRKRRYLREHESTTVQSSPSPAFGPIITDVQTVLDVFLKLFGTPFCGSLGTTSTNLE